MNISETSPAAVAAAAAGNKLEQLLLPEASPAVANSNNTITSQPHSTVTIALPESSDDSDSEPQQEQQEDELDEEDEEDELTAYNKDYEAVLRIREELESNKKLSLFDRQRICPAINTDWLRPSKHRENKVIWFVIVLLIVIVTGLALIYYFYEPQFYYVYTGDGIRLNEKTLDLELYASDGQIALRGRLFQTVPGGKLPLDCSGTADQSLQQLCLQWKDLQLLHIRNYRTDNATCHDVTWTALDPEVVAMDCYLLDSARLYGGGLLNGKHQWPVDGAKFSSRAFISGSLDDSESFGPVLERYWLTSHGVSIFVSENSSLYLSLNEREFCLVSETSHLPADSPLRINTTFAYTLCVADSARLVHEALASRFASRRAYTVLPPSAFTRLVWSTWAVFKTRFNQSTLLEFSRDVQRANNGSSTSSSSEAMLLLVDDGWENKYGDLELMTSQFPDPQAMLQQLHESNFTVSFWVHLQLNTDSRSFETAVNGGMLMQASGEDVPGLTQWWNGPDEVESFRGVAGVLDMSNEQAVDWHNARLQQLISAHALDSVHYHSVPCTTGMSQQSLDLNQVTRLAGHVASQLATNDTPVFVQSAYRAQDLPVIIRLTGGSSSWNGTGGLASVIPTLLSLGLVGYPLILPEPVGGSAVSEPPSQELYVRWLELAAFLPIMHFSIPPDHYDSETQSIARRMIRLHNAFTVPLLLTAINDSLLDLNPVYRPVWWNGPRDLEAGDIIDEFLMGDLLLVAPVLVPGARHRDIYLPAGVWQNPLTEQVHFGPTWLYQYAVHLDQIAHFVRLVI